MKGIAKSTQGVESAKSTSKRWLATRTKKRWVAVVALSLCFVFCMSFGLQQVLKTKRVDVSPPTQDVQVSQDFEQLAEKYIDFFVQNDNGTVSLDLSNKLRTSGIDEQDLADLQEYAKTLDLINGFVHDGTMVVDENGDYVVGDGQEKDARDLNGGKNEFYVRTKKVVFINVPVGYRFSLGSMGAIIFGGITAIVAWGSNILFLANGKQQLFDRIIKALAIGANTAAWFFMDANIEWMFNLLYAIYVVGMAIDAAVGAATAGAGAVVSTVVKTVVAIIGNYVFNTIGYDFLLNGVRNAFGENGNHNTVVAETNLILQNRSFWTARC